MKNQTGQFRNESFQQINNKHGKEVTKIEYDI